MMQAELDKVPAGSSIAIAVSGGPDSMALCLLTHHWAKKRGIKVLALTVDHGLRPESGEEAKRVRDWLTNVGIGHEILHRPWDKPAQPGHIQEAARKHRYMLLYEKCRSEGIHNLLTAHQLEDQVETFIMRLAHFSGVDGLAGIQKRHAQFFPPVPPGSGSAKAAMTSTRLAPPLFPPLSNQTLNTPSSDSYPSPLYIVRPLLEVSKDRLMATCAHFGQEAVDDPTNQNMTFHRNRIRQALPLLWETIGKEDLSRTIYHFQKARNEMQAEVNAIMRTHSRFSTRPFPARFSPFGAEPSLPSPQFLGHVYLPVSLFGGSRDSLSLPLSMRVLQAALVSVGGLRAERLSLKLPMLREITERMQKTAAYAAGGITATQGRGLTPILPDHLKATFTACGCLIQLLSSPHQSMFVICPERRMTSEKEPIRPGETLLWENRLAISFTVGGRQPQRRASTASQPPPTTDDRFFVRRLTTKDYKVSHVIGTAVREVPSDIRVTTPVIVDERDRLVALPTLRFLQNRPDLVFTTAPVFPLTSEPSPCAPPAQPDELSAKQKFDMLLAQLDEFDRIADQLDDGADDSHDSRDKPPQTR